MLLVYLYKQLIQIIIQINIQIHIQIFYTNTYANTYINTYTRLKLKKIQQIKYVILRNFLFYPEILYFIRCVANEKSIPRI